MTIKDHNASNYFHCAFESPAKSKELLKRLRQALKNKSYEYVVVSGVSGLIIGPTLAYLENKRLIVVRKGLDGHASWMTEGIPAPAYVKGKPQPQAFNYLIVDDFVCSGATVERIRGEIAKRCPKAKLIGIAQYRPDYKPFVSDRQYQAAKAKRDLNRCVKLASYDY